MKLLMLVFCLSLAGVINAGTGLKSAALENGDLAYQDRGEGEAVLMIHGALVADSFVPLMDHSALADYRRIRYQRRGYAESGALDIAPEDFLRHATNDAIALLDHLEVDRAHVVGHSSGGVIAMELARQAPERVRSLVLLEPPMMAVPAAEDLLEVIGQAGAHFEAGEPDRAVDAFLSRLTRPDWQELMANAVPGSVEQALGNAGTFFETEAPGVGYFELNRYRAEQIRAPALYVLGTESSAISGAENFFEQGRDRLLEELPHADSRTLDEVDHSLQIGFPDQVAPVIAEFLGQHPDE